MKYVRAAAFLVKRLRGPSGRTYFWGIGWVRITTGTTHRYRVMSQLGSGKTQFSNISVKSLSRANVKPQKAEQGSG